jgi:hypothetical protein
MYPDDYSAAEGYINIYSQVSTITLDSNGYIHVSGMNTDVSKATGGV